MKTAAIVQARIGSTRLPSKILKKLPGRETALDEVLRRCAAVPGVDVVVCAIPSSPEDKLIAPIAEESGAVVIEGDAQDVLSRYLKGAHAVGADVVLRVTSDCPLIDPGVCGEVLRLREETNSEYACNNAPPSFPHGLDCEAFTTDALRKASQMTDDPFDREHVTPWLRRAPEIKRASLTLQDQDWSVHRWTLDYTEDYEFFQQVFALLPPRPEIISWTNVLEILHARPEISAINRSRHVLDR